jgi:hypothetical protein
LRANTDDAGFEWANYWPAALVRRELVVNVSDKTDKRAAAQFLSKQARRGGNDNAQRFALSPARS